MCHKYDNVCPKYDCICLKYDRICLQYKWILRIYDFIFLNICGFILIMTRLVLNICGFVPDMTDFFLNMASFVKFNPMSLAQICFAHVYVLRLKRIPAWLINNCLDLSYAIICYHILYRLYEAIIKSLPNKLVKYKHN